VGKLNEESQILSSGKMNIQEQMSHLDEPGGFK